MLVLVLVLMRDVFWDNAKQVRNKRKENDLQE